MLLFHSYGMKNTTYVFLEDSEVKKKMKRRCRLVFVFPLFFLYFHELKKVNLEIAKKRNKKRKLFQFVYFFNFSFLLQHNKQYINQLISINGEEKM